jgi:hypothetical protein
VPAGVVKRTLSNRSANAVIVFSDRTAGSVTAAIHLRTGSPIEQSDDVRKLGPSDCKMISVVGDLCVHSTSFMLH